MGAHTRVDVLRRNVPHGAPPRHKRETTNKQNPRPTSVEQQPRGARTASYGEGRDLWRSLVPRAGDPCTERSRTRRHFSGVGRVQREGARGQLCAAFFLGAASLLCYFGHSPILGGNLPQSVQKTLGSSLEQRPGGRGYMDMSL